MTKRIIRRIAITIGSMSAVLALILAVHIYLVTRPGKPAPDQPVMARIDLQQPINQTDANKISAWLYQQKGIDHVLCNPSAAIVVFTFFPGKTSANEVVSRFVNELPYKGNRFMPTAEQMKGGCPVAANSISGTISSFLKRM